MNQNVERDNSAFSALFLQVVIFKYFQPYHFFGVHDLCNIMTYGGGFPATVVCLQMVAARPRSDVRLGFTDLLMQVGQGNFSS